MFCVLMLSVVILIVSMEGVILLSAIVLIIALNIILLYVILLSVAMLYINNKCCYTDCARYYYADVTMLNNISII